MTTTDRMSVPDAREALEKAGLQTQLYRGFGYIGVVRPGGTTRELLITGGTVSRAEVMALAEREK